jgi:hypothetical protein
VAWPEGFFGEAETPVFEALTRRRRAYGTGRTVLFSQDLAAAYGRAIGLQDVLAVRALRRAIADALAEHGVRPPARASHPAVEVGLRLCDGAALLVAVNHADEPVETRVELDPGAAPTACAYDLATGEEVAVEAAAGRAVVLTLGARDGGVFALYPEPPYSLRLELPQASFRRGESLRYKVLLLGGAGQPARGSHIVRVAVADAAGDERPEHGGDRVAVHGALDVAEPFAANDPPGAWTLSVTDILTRRLVRRTFELSE